MKKRSFSMKERRGCGESSNLPSLPYESIYLSGMSCEMCGNSVEQDSSTNNCFLQELNAKTKLVKSDFTTYDRKKTKKTKVLKTMQKIQSTLQQISTEKQKIRKMLSLMFQEFGELFQKYFQSLLVENEKRMKQKDEQKDSQIYALVRKVQMLEKENCGLKKMLSQQYQLEKLNLSSSTPHIVLSENNNNTSQMPSLSSENKVKGSRRKMEIQFVEDSEEEYCIKILFKPKNCSSITNKAANKTLEKNQVEYYKPKSHKRIGTSNGSRQVKGNKFDNRQLMIVKQKILNLRQKLQKEKEVNFRDL